MTGEGALIAGRSRALSRMKATATACRMTGEQVTVGDFEVDEYAPVVSSQPLRISGAPRGSATYRRFTLPGGLDVQAGFRVAHWPPGVARLQDGDVIGVESGENADTFWRVIEGDWQDDATAYRVPVIATTRPAGWPEDES